MITNELEVDLQASIAKHLPNHVGETLKKQLERLSALEKDNKRLNDLAGSLNVEKTELLKRVKSQEELDELSLQLKDKEHELMLRELKFETETLKYQLDAEKDKTVFSKNVALGLVRNIEYRQAVYDSEAGLTAHVDQYGNQIHKNTVKSYNRTDTAE